jgi:hypothetical protein
VQQNPDKNPNPSFHGEIEVLIVAACLSAELLFSGRCQPSGQQQCRTGVAGESASCCLQGNPLLNIGLIYSFFKALQGVTRVTEI